MDWTFVSHFWDHLLQLGTWANIAGIGAALGMILRMLWKRQVQPKFWDPIKAAADQRHARATTEMLKPIIAEMLEPVYHELTTNSGGSIKDVTTRTACDVEQLRKSQEQIIAWQDSHVAEDQESFSEVRRRIEEGQPIVIALTEEQRQLDEYTHRRNHDIINALTSIKGKVDMMWQGWLSERGLQSDDVVIPEAEVEVEPTTEDNP